MVNFEKARKDSEAIEILGYEGFFTHQRVNRETIPEGWFAYDIRGGNDGEYYTLEENVASKHIGTFLTTESVELRDGYQVIEEGNYRFL